MSRLSDLLNEPMAEETPEKLPPIQIPSKNGPTAAHAPDSTIASPLGKIALNSQTEPTLSASQNLGEQEEESKPQIQSSEPIGRYPVPVSTALPVPYVKIENLQATDGARANTLDAESRTPVESIESATRQVQIKKEESQDLTPARVASPPASSPGMGTKSGPKKRPPTTGPKKPGPKKRKLDSRADTPQSQRSGTPNSMLGGKAVSRAKKHNSATPMHSSPAPDDEGDDEESDDGVYCICRKGDDHSWMIACDGGCDDWFHGRCVGIDQRDGNLIDRFICPNCSDSKGAETTWKTMCRLDGCREPAAITGPKPSKYCCDDHAVQFFQRLIKNGFGADTAAAAKKRRKDNMTDHSQNRNEGYEKPPHLRGGLLSPAELKTITNGLQSHKEFRSLGEGVPGVSDAEGDDTAMQIDTKPPNYTNHESEQLEKVMSRAAQSRQQLISLENRERFLALVKNRAKGAQEELKKKDKSMKDMCGFDKRLRLSDSDFDAWCDTEEGKEAFKTGKLLPIQVDADGDADMSNTDEIGKGLCMKKRCKQHEGWFKLHSLEFAYGKTDVVREIAKATAEEQSIRERATIRQLESRS